MLRTVLDLEGDCFEERWAQVERRVRRHCDAAELAYPEETLQAIRPWFATVGDWFDWAGIVLQGPVLFPSDVDPVLRVVREADQLRVFYDEDLNTRCEFSEGYEYFTSTIRWANLAFLRVVQDGQRGDPQYHPRLRDSAILALAEYVDSTDPLIYGSRRNRVKSALNERAGEREGKSAKDLWLPIVATTVQKAIRHLYETVEVRPNPLTLESYLDRLSIGRDVLLDRLESVPEPLDGSESITVLGRYPTFSPQMESLLKGSKASNILMRNLLPGGDPSELRYAAESVIAEDLLGPDARKILRSDEPDPPESLHTPVAQDADSDEEHTLLDQMGRDDPNFGRFEAQQTLRRLIDRANLTGGEHQAFAYRELHGFSVEETAEQMGSTKGSVSALVSKAKSKLRDVMEGGDLT